MIILNTGSIGPPTWVACHKPTDNQLEEEYRGLFQSFRQQHTSDEIEKPDQLKQMIIGEVMAALSSLDTPIYFVCSMATCPRKTNQLVQPVVPLGGGVHQEGVGGEDE